MEQGLGRGWPTLGLLLCITHHPPQPLGPPPLSRVLAREGPPQYQKGNLTRLASGGPALPDARAEPLLPGAVPPTCSWRPRLPQHHLLENSQPRQRGSVHSPPPPRERERGTLNHPSADKGNFRTNGQDASLPRKHPGRQLRANLPPPPTHRGFLHSPLGPPAGTYLKMLLSPRQASCGPSTGVSGTESCMQEALLWGPFGLGLQGRGESCS